VLGEERRKEIGERLQARYTMESERALHDGKRPGKESEMDGVELF
jgi:hypothetical protein